MKKVENIKESWVLLREWISDHSPDQNCYDTSYEDFWEQVSFVEDDLAGLIIKLLMKNGEEKKVQKVVIKVIGEHNKKKPFLVLPIYRLEISGIVLILKGTGDKWDVSLKLLQDWTIDFSKLNNQLFNLRINKRKGIREISAILPPENGYVFIFIYIVFNILVRILK